ncbi:MAG: phosphatidylglycerophosphatase A [Candidatus Omnitrophota bacterium]|nr:phosphatidylglycerophosphatase A [Candidatus Omnitrophota bacterium]
MNTDKIKLSDKTCVAITTLFGIGYAPLLGGTLASIVAVVIFILIKNQLYFFIFTTISLILAFSLSDRAEKIFEEKDCKKIVIDDFSGMLVSLLFIPYDIKFIICGFLLFRMFDAFKIPPIDRIECLPGAKGVVGDDLAAGIFTLIILHVARLALKIAS